MTALVKRLRDYFQNEGSGWPVMAQAADRIEHLEGALKSQMAATTRLAQALNFSGQDIADCTSQARAALENK